MKTKVRWNKHQKTGKICFFKVHMCSLVKKLWCSSWFSDLQSCRCNFKINVIIPVSGEGALTQFDLVLKGKHLETNGLNSGLQTGITVSPSFPPFLCSHDLGCFSWGIRFINSVGRPTFIASIHLLTSYVLMTQGFIVMSPFEMIYLSCRNTSDCNLIKCGIYLPNRFLHIWQTPTEVFGNVGRLLNVVDLLQTKVVCGRSHICWASWLVNQEWIRRAPGEKTFSWTYIPPS